MACYSVLLIVSIVIALMLSLHLLQSTSSTAYSTTPPIACETRYCGIPIEFPFQLKEDDNNSYENRGCRYNNEFEVSCNRNRNISSIILPKAGEFIITNISLQQHKIWINDPDNCLANRFLQSKKIELGGSPFNWDYEDSNHVIFNFYNCTESEGNLSSIDPNLRIPCLSYDKHYSVVVINNRDPVGSGYSSWCRKIGSEAMIPVKDFQTESSYIRNQLVYSDIMLKWFEPNCFCAADQYCGFSPDANFSQPDDDVTCYDKGGSENPQNPGNSSHKLVSIAWGISIFLFLGWILLSVYDNLRYHNQQGANRRLTTVSNTEQAPPYVVDEGIEIGGGNYNRRTIIDIEQFPKIQLSETVQLPKSIDNVCSICLSEYEENDTLRNMPQCNHYFHAHCIDSWFNMNSTCPLCRNFPLPEL